MKQEIDMQFSENRKNMRVILRTYFAFICIPYFWRIKLLYALSETCVYYSLDMTYLILAIEYLR